MVPSISYFYVYYNQGPLEMVFIKYDNFMKIKLDYNEIVLSFDDFIVMPEIFELYILSLLMSNNINIQNNNNKYRLLFDRYLNKGMSFTYAIDSIYLGSRNPLNKKSPKRQSSGKKIRKFFKNFNNKFIRHHIHPTQLIQNYLMFETTNAIY